MMVAFYKASILFSLVYTFVGLPFCDRIYFEPNIVKLCRYLMFARISKTNSYFEISDDSELCFM